MEGTSQRYKRRRENDQSEFLGMWEERRRALEALGEAGPVWELQSAGTFSEHRNLLSEQEQDQTGDICPRKGPVCPSLFCPSQVIKEVQEFYKDTYHKLKSKDEPQRDTLKAIHYAVRHPRKSSLGARMCTGT